MLYYQGKRFTRDGTFADSTNWRCCYFRDKCRARAITKQIGEETRVRVTNAIHTCTEKRKRQRWCHARRSRVYFVFNWVHIFLEISFFSIKNILSKHFYPKKNIFLFLQILFSPRFYFVCYFSVSNIVSNKFEFSCRIHTRSTIYSVEARVTIFDRQWCEIRTRQVRPLSNAFQLIWSFIKYVCFYSQKNQRNDELEVCQLY